MDATIYDLINDNASRLGELTDVEQAQVLAAIESYDFGADEARKEWQQSVVARFKAGDWSDPGALIAGTLAAGFIVRCRA
jgi:hypothetical protein